jgi:hypothetical protein
VANAGKARTVLFAGSKADLKTISLILMGQHMGET